MTHSTFSPRQAILLKVGVAAVTGLVYIVFIMLMNAHVAEGWPRLVWLVLVGWLPVLGLFSAINWVEAHTDWTKRS